MKQDSETINKEITDKVDNLLIKAAKKPNCNNCKFAGNKFKISGLTHLHCENNELYPKEGWESGKFSEWDTLKT